MRPGLPTALLALLLPGCAVESAPRSATLVFPHEAVRIDGVCPGSTGTRGLGVSEVAPFANGQRRFRVVNESGAPHEVQPGFVVANVGRCDRGWASSSKHALQDPATCSAPVASTLAPGQSVELRLQPHREVVPDGCTKVGIALHATVDGQPACVEMGSWLLYRHGED